VVQEGVHRVFSSFAESLRREGLRADDALSRRGVAAAGGIGGIVAPGMAGGAGALGLGLGLGLGAAGGGGLRTMVRV
jgi:hypothetical protein